MTAKKPTMKEVKETKAYNIKDVSLTLHRIDEDKRVLVRQKDRNDGVAVWRSVAVVKGKQYDNVSIAPFYEDDKTDDDGRNLIRWKSSVRKFDRPRKMFYQYNLVNINKDAIPDLIEALQEIAGVAPKEYEMKPKAKKKDDMWDKAKDVLGV